jgi:hypothetical protein
MKATIKPITKGAQVAIGMLPKTQGMKGSAEAGFQVTDHGVNPAEVRTILGMATINNHWLMDSSHLCHSPEASQPIGDDLTTSCQGVLYPVCDGCEEMVATLNTCTSMGFPASSGVSVQGAGWLTWNSSPAEPLTAA